MIMWAPRKMGTSIAPRTRPYKTTHIHIIYSCFSSKQNHMLWIYGCFFVFSQICNPPIFPLNSISCHFLPFKCFKVSSFTHTNTSCISTIDKQFLPKIKTMYQNLRDFLSMVATFQLYWFNFLVECFNTRQFKILS